jgi:hypothetical protein
MRRGISLMEALIGLAIMSIIVTGMLSMYSRGQQYFINETVMGNAMEETRYPFAWIARDIKTAVSVASAWTVGSATYTTSASTLVLSVPSVDANGIIIEDPADPLGTHVDHVIYAIAFGKLQRVYDAKDGVSGKPDGSRFLADNVNGLTFTYYDDDGAVLASGFDAAASVRAKIDVRQRGVGSRYFNQSLDSEFKLRNK